MPHMTATMTSEMRQCADECLRCYATCMETVQHCLHMGGRHAEQQHVATLLACAAICQASATALLAGSHHHTHTCESCAAICRACAEECRAISDGDAIMNQCADACARCADSCERMARA